MKRPSDMRRRAASFRRLWSDRRGIAAVEFGLLSAVLLALALAGIDGGLAYWTQTAVDGAARAGADYADIHGSSDTSGIVSAATGATSLTVSVPAPTTYCGCASTTGLVVQACNTTCSGGATIGTYVSVVVSKNYTPILSWLWTSKLTNGVVNLTSTVVTRTQ
jgi:Flp pilus assembly protein TadG